MAHGCIGKKVAQGEITIQQAAQLFTMESNPAIRVQRAEAALTKYKAHQASLGTSGQQHGKAPQGVAPTKKLVMCTKVVKKCLHSRPLHVDHHGEVQDWRLVGVDSKADQHIFGDSRVFVDGYEPLATPVVIMTVEGVVENLAVLGKGTATMITRNGERLEFPNALYCPNITTDIISVKQAMQQSQAEARFGEHCDIVFRGGNGYSIPDGHQAARSREVAQDRARLRQDRIVLSHSCVHAVEHSLSSKMSQGSAKMDLVSTNSARNSVPLRESLCVRLRLSFPHCGASPHEWRPRRWAPLQRTSD